jgi:hypothetical protein
MALIAVACTVGTLIKQEPYDAPGFIARYGKTLGLLIGLLGLNNLYHTFWFLALLALFALSTVACALPRLRFRARTLGSGIVHLSIVFIVAGAIIKGAAGIEGMIQIPEGHSVGSIPREGEAVPLGFRLHLDDFAIEHYEGRDLLLTQAHNDTTVRQIRFKVGDVVELDSNGTTGEILQRKDTQDEMLIVQSKDEKTPRQVPFKVGDVIEVDGSGTTAEILRYVPDFTYSFEDKKVVSKSDNPVNPAIQVRVKTSEGQSDGWLFARFPSAPHKPPEWDKIGLTLRYASSRGPAIQIKVNAAGGENTLWLYANAHAPYQPKSPDMGPAMRFTRDRGPIKAFSSHVTVMDEEGNELRKAVIQVNRPLRQGRYTFYQSSYDKETERVTVLEVVYDPGVWFVYIGFTLMPLGMAYVFYIQPVLRRRARNAA